MPLIPHRFLFRLSLPCKHLAAIPIEDGDVLLGLPEECRIDNFSDMDERKNFADVRVAWNEGGIGIQVEVRGKDRAVQGDTRRPRQSDGITVWIDTRDARTSHRASRYCHQFHLLATGGGADQGPVLVQTKINRAQQDSPLAPEGAIPFRGRVRGSRYLLEAFFPAGVLHGFDPEQNRRLGFSYLVRDDELGEQALSVGLEFPVAEDPSLWSVLELMKGE